MTLDEMTDLFTRGRSRCPAANGCHMSAWFRSWANHAALNLGGALASVCYALLPPQMTQHSEPELLRLRASHPCKWFLAGLCEQEFPNE